MGKHSLPDTLTNVDNGFVIGFSALLLLVITLDSPKAGFVSLCLMALGYQTGVAVRRVDGALRSAAILESNGLA